MGRRRYRRRVHINPEAARGILVLFFAALAGLLLLSMADLAGAVGRFIQSYASLLFGWDYIFIPFVFLLLCTAALYPDRRYLTAFRVIGLILFFLSFNALVHLLWVKSPSPTQDMLREAGGVVGVLFGRIFENLLGYWGSLLVLILLTLVAALLIFNASLRQVVDAHARLLRPLRALVRRPSFRSREEPGEFNEDENFEEDIVEDIPEETDTGGDDEIKTAKAPSRAKEISALKEQPLTTRVQRKIEIPLDLLEHRNAKAMSGDIEHNKEVVQSTFREFGIDVEMSEVSVGPTVTQYTLRPPRGVKLTRILSLQNDLALALAAHPIRIEAPIPGKSLVGIEVPNQTVATVSLRALLESKEFLKAPSKLAFALGRDVAGEAWVTQLDRMPHLLVAGATGSGKSVCLNAIIVSLLYANGPDELKLIMIDPKRVELTAYEGTPHLLVPPITKVDDAVNALKWTIREMERRLDVLSKFGAKDIKGFNSRSQEKMPYIIVIIDELADLMMSSGREVEASIVRIAQLARATGIHLVIATQRPSVDVITGIIKANFPGRIAFAVASQTDSRTILDMAGAEKLLGRGDMLFTTAELSKPKRLQGAFVSEKEIERVVDFLKHNGTPDYNYSITERARSATLFDGTDEDDELLDEAIHYMISAGKASTSMLQRRLKIGYSRAARIMDILEEKGIIGPQDGAKPREVLVESWPPENVGDTVTTQEREFAEAGLEPEILNEATEASSGKSVEEDDEEEKQDTYEFRGPTT
ncbi:DNA translocase FtsK 4TM domain-containing protein [Candidatus Uhrbacteria bacterium]|nr:DNA translocase FtsK 4TM domain-containing protein [Candidatus Uhrbacteria bacterium]